MALARLTKQCRECPFVETCEHKEVEALGYLPEPIMTDAKVPVTADIAAPNNTNNSDRMNTVAYKIGQAIALVACLCVSAIVIALTVKCILWIL